MNNKANDNQIVFSLVIFSKCEIRQQRYQINNMLPSLSIVVNPTILDKGYSIFAPI